MPQSSHIPNAAGVRDATDRRIALLLGALSLAIYLRTLAPGLLAGDAGEFQFAAWNFGLAHPTGYPLYMMLGGLWQHLLAMLTIPPATALNVLSALFGAISVALVYWLMRGWVDGTRTAQRMVGIFTATLFAVNPTFWNQSLIAEVYALHALFIALILLAAQRVARSQEGQMRSRLVLLWLLVGLSLTHHATTMLLVPALLVYLWFVDGPPWRNGRTLILCVAALLLPLLLYLYVPLRSGPIASPWYHQDLGGEILHLYQNDWGSFVRFITGQSISVGFRSMGDALGQAGFAARQWHLHFTWAGLVLILLGWYALMVQRRWAVLALTAVYALTQQVFNLFYAIDDIFVYYIPLYLVGALWAGFAAAQLASGQWRGSAAERTPAPEEAAQPSQFALHRGPLPILLLFLIPATLVRTYLPQIDQSDAVGTRLRWEEILAAAPPADAILISNDRDEIVPLFYLQHVEDRVPGLSGLFPLIAPEPRFADIGTTVDTALAVSGERPVYLIKPMPGLDVRFQLAARTPPLYEALGPAATAPPAISVEEALGPLTLLGYDVAALDDTTVTDGVQVRIYWRVDAPLSADYTTTVQLYDSAQQRIAQSDSQPGGLFYPTSLWKAGEVLVENHILEYDDAQTPTDMLVGMYTGPAIELLAPPLELSWLATQ